MIIEQNTEIKIMQTLVKYWYRDFSAYALAKESEVTAPMVYKILKKLIAKGQVKQTNSKIHANFNNLFTYRFKQLYDADRLIALPEPIQKKIAHTFQVMQSEYKQDLQAFIIFGSIASGENTEASDLDLLVIVDKKKEIDYRKKGLLSMGDINIIEKTVSEFENDYLLAHDLTLNALMNGIIIFDDWLIRFLLEKPLPVPSYEVILEKKERLCHLKERLLRTLKDQDNKLLVEQFKQYIIEKGRILLLQEGIIPSSKQNILDTLKTKDRTLHSLHTRANEKNIKELVTKHV